MIPPNIPVYQTIEVEGMYTGYYPLGSIDADEIRVQVWWTSLNAFDGLVKLCVREHDHALWLDVPTLTQVLDNDGDNKGTVEFIYSPCSGRYAALYIDPGTATTGLIKSIFNRVTR